MKSPPLISNNALLPPGVLFLHLQSSPRLLNGREPRNLTTSVPLLLMIVCQSLVSGSQSKFPLFMGKTQVIIYLYITRLIPSSSFHPRIPIFILQIYPSIHLNNASVQSVQVSPSSYSASSFSDSTPPFINDPSVMIMSHVTSAAVAVNPKIQLPIHPAHNLDSFLQD